jgi:nitroreductase
MSNSASSSSITNELNDALQWRYATKAFDSSKQITNEDWMTLKGALQAAPSSFGLQPWKFIEVTSPELRQKIKANAWNQSQVVDASKLVILAAKKNMAESDVIRLIKALSAQRNIPEAALADYQGMMTGFIKAPPFPLNIEEWTTRQVYIALGVLLTSAALLKIDACPMEGFNPAAVDEILGLTNTEYSVKVLCPLGYRSSTDKYAELKKVRYSQEEIFEVR